MYQQIYQRCHLPRAGAGAAELGLCHDPLQRRADTFGHDLAQPCKDCRYFRGGGVGRYPRSKLFRRGRGLNRRNLLARRRTRKKSLNLSRVALPKLVQRAELGGAIEAGAPTAFLMFGILDERTASLMAKGLTPRFVAAACRKGMASGSLLGGFWGSALLCGPAL
jgi:hypothetical protein